MLDPKRERFVEAYRENGGNAAEAFREANPRARKWKNMNAAQVKGCNMLKEPAVQQALAELQAQARERHHVTVESLTDELDADREDARKAGQFSAAISAVGLKAKLHGLIKNGDNTTLVVPPSAPAPVINVILSSNKSPTPR